MNKLFATILILAAVAGAIWFTPLRATAAKLSAHLMTPSANPIPAKYIAEVERRLIDYSVDVAGDVAPEFQLDVKSEVGGKIKSLLVEPGQVVKAGELLCEIDDTDLQNEKASAQTDIEGQKLAVERALRNFQRSKKLYGDKLITKEAFDNLESDLAIARNDLVKSQRRLQSVVDRISKAKIVAPSAGTVLQVPVILGQVIVPAASVNAGTTLMTIADLSKLLVTTHINQVDVARLHVKQPVTLTVESIKEEVLEGSVSFIAPVATVKNGVKGFIVEALVLKPSPRMRPGMTVSLTIPVIHVEGALAVPVSAIFKGKDDNRVVYVLNDDKPEPKGVTVGDASLDYAEIKSGVQLGDRILTVEPRVLEKTL
ncbi:MAG: efflux RND transporter periplasmic adaptor subunit [Verrucomicrobiota bacterium]